MNASKRLMAESRQDKRSVEPYLVQTTQTPPPTSSTLLEIHLFGIGISRQRKANPGMLLITTGRDKLIGAIRGLADNKLHAEGDK